MLQVEHVQREDLHGARGNLPVRHVASLEHLYLTDFITQRALEMSDLFQIHVEREPPRAPGVERVHMLEVKVEVPSELAVTTAYVYGISITPDEGLAHAVRALAGMLRNLLRAFSNIEVVPFAPLLLVGIGFPVGS
jgi:hypothetical protein